MTTPPNDLDLLLVAIAAIATPWKKWPGGYPDRPDYGRERSGGTWTRARGAVLRYEKYSEHVTALTKMEHLANQNPVALERVLNRQKVHSGKTKASAIVEAAQRFIDIGSTQPAHLNAI